MDQSTLAPVPSVPPRPPLPARPRDAAPAPGSALVLAAVLVALLVYSWIDVGGSVAEFFTGMFGSKGLFADIVPAVGAARREPDLAGHPGGDRRPSPSPC